MTTSCDISNDSVLVQSELWWPTTALKINKSGVKWPIYLLIPPPPPTATHLLSPLK